MKTMRCLIILLLSNFWPAHATEESLRWYPSKIRFPEGECVRLHTPSQGNSYVEKVKAEECRPEKTSYLWANNACYEVDAASLGQAFGVRLKDVTKCAPEGSLYSFDEVKRECWLVDPSGGLSFKAKLDQRECRPLEDNLTKKFFPAARGFGGECLEIHRTEGAARWEKRIQVTECRPPSTNYLWRPTGEFKGECWEVAPEGAQAYSDKVVSDRCRPVNVTYVFERTSEKRGDCFEVDPETKGQRWARKVAPNLCRVSD